MLGKLTRYLRLLGFDAVYADDLESRFNTSPIPDEKLRLFAEEDGRIVITKDRPFHEIIIESSIFLNGEGVYNYLDQLKKELNLSYGFEINKARCSTCNSRLEKVKDKSSIKNRVKPDSFNHYDDFYQCLKCDKIFWKGSHIEKILKNLKKMEIYG